MKLPGTVGARNVASPFVYLDAGDHAGTDKINIGISESQTEC